MNKAELIASIADHAGMTKADAGRALDAFIDIVTDSLKWREEISLVGFGTFSVKDRAARTGRNPATGAEIQIAASKAVSFRVGKALKDAVNN
jgi:DNA-binding protein HU-beta